MITKLTKATGVFNLDAVTMLSNQVELFNKKIDGLYGSTQVHPVMRCDSNGGVHNADYPSFNPGGNQRPQHPLGFQQPLYQQEKKPNLEEMLTKFIAVSETRFQNTEIALKNHLPSNTETNPREQLNAITVRDEERLVEPKLEPSSLQMSNAVKFLKELLANKRKLDDASHVELNAVCSAILHNRLPNKLKGPESFTIPCLIGSLNVNNALADLAESINVMPYKMFKQLGLGKPKQTRMSIQLVDKTIRFARGIIGDVLVKINKFIFPIDFIVLDMEEDNDVPLILGQPFLATAKTIIDVSTSELILRVGDNITTQTSLQVSSRKNVTELYSNPYHKIERLTKNEGFRSMN
ncbi:hypothetical protein CXB51_008633 [Gossypium anomalum]|uniref:Aspartic peptidase DDI1-type domain-containing protein n=1 Tax=Gossypium anomalum TaxID=47600 RepID=A0A8J5ZFF0_9ROSI|nr:hypothetical protein CXB51_008633 [Gossypium anomalum]